MTTETQTQHEAARCGLMSYAEAYGSLRGLFTVLEWDLSALERRLDDPELDKQWSHEEFVKSARDITTRAMQIVNTFKEQQ